MDVHDVYRGQVISVETGRHGGSRIVFLERPEMSSSELVLPDGTLARIEQHVLGPTRHRDALLAGGRHLSRGLLLWGPPGTGKTHTVRYLTAHLSDATIILLSGGTLGMVGAFATLARRLAPSLVVLEDVDLVAQERTYSEFGTNPVIFELMNQLSGLGDDADVAFVLTTNRPDALEPALAARPGRVDLAVEIPLPDRDARRRLFELYARRLDLAVTDMDAVVDRTKGVTASFVKELLRKAALVSAEAGRATVTDADLHAALDELMASTSAMTRVLLGVSDGESAARPADVGHAWLQSFPGWAPHGE
jgi:ATP-dependent 26S proteasome regulatory subunit